MKVTPETFNNGEELDIYSIGRDSIGTHRLSIRRIHQGEYQLFKKYHVTGDGDAPDEKIVMADKDGGSVLQRARQVMRDTIEPDLLTLWTPYRWED